MNVTQTLVSCILAFFVVDYYYRDDYNKRVLQMVLDRNFELEKQIEILTPPSAEEAEFIRLWDYADKKTRERK